MVGVGGVDFIVIILITVIIIAVVGCDFGTVLLVFSLPKQRMSVNSYATCSRKTQYNHHEIYLSLSLNMTPPINGQFPKQRTSCLDVFFCSVRHVSDALLLLLFIIVVVGVVVVLFVVCCFLLFVVVCLFLLLLVLL